ncbi:hypothetical protein F2Q68_00039292 [Brassica cretica]|uniref:Jacalin-type lectin domain-containing protein n=1 Tax=Brassica cretica TaxID=69181 RepID=A0A8S9MGN6_BRACR|nr:hypothetical protein F2Q68_00039292 [Brassica cretica]
MSYAPILSHVPQKLDAVGCGDESYDKWDDGSKYADVCKICVGMSSGCIQYVKFYYVKDGGDVEHGGSGGFDNGCHTHIFDIYQPEEYLVSVNVWCNTASDLIQKMKFKTNTREYETDGGISANSRLYLRVLIAWRVV